jgi:hypothetical protein
MLINLYEIILFCGIDVLSRRKKMSSHREGIFVEGLWTEGAEGNSEIPEVGASSAPLLSASFFFDSQCADFNQDFMICKKQARNDPFACQKEGARVTRCAISLYIYG